MLSPSSKKSGATMIVQIDIKLAKNKYFLTYVNVSKYLERKSSPTHYIKQYFTLRIQMQRGSRGEGERNRDLSQSGVCPQH